MENSSRSGSSSGSAIGLTLIETGYGDDVIEGLGDAGARRLNLDRLHVHVPIFSSLYGFLPILARVAVGLGFGGKPVEPQLRVVRSHLPDFHASSPIAVCLHAHAPPRGLARDVVQVRLGARYRRLDRLSEHVPAGPYFRRDIAGPVGHAARGKRGDHFGFPFVHRVASSISLTVASRSALSAVIRAKYGELFMALTRTRRNSSAILRVAKSRVKSSP